MKLKFTRIRMMLSNVAPAYAVALALLASACDGAEQSGDSSYGTESHFLSECNKDSECTGALSCLGGRCSKACTQDGDCAELAQDSVCAPTPGESGKSCAAACAEPATCSDDDVPDASSEAPAPSQPAPAPTPSSEPSGTGPNAPSPSASASSSPDSGTGMVPPASAAADAGSSPADAGASIPSQSQPDASVGPGTVEPTSDAGTTPVADASCPLPCNAGESCVALADGYQCVAENCAYDSCHPERCDQIGENCCDPFPGDGVNYCNGGLVCGADGCEAPADVAPERLCGTVVCADGNICCDECTGSCVNALSGAYCPPQQCGDSFACGPDLTCATATQYCESFTGGPIPDPTYTCFDYPDPCTDTPTCACLAAAAGFTGPCTASAQGGLTVEESAP